MAGLKNVQIQIAHNEDHYFVKEKLLDYFICLLS
jgi:hypothetical protein